MKVCPPVGHEIGPPNHPGSKTKTKITEVNSFFHNETIAFTIKSFRIHNSSSAFGIFHST